LPPLPEAFRKESSVPIDIEKLVISENLVSDIELEGDIGIIASKLLELEKYYLGQGYSDIKLEMQYTATDATYYSVFGNRLETDREHHARLRDMKRERDLKARRELYRETSDSILFDLLRQRFEISNRV
jgi:hypothetical protein